MQHLEHTTFLWKITLAALLILACFTHSLSQEDRDVFQNQQRALQLALVALQIKSLDDAPIRCLVRTQILRFIFEAKVKEQYDTANTLALECMEDIQRNPSQFSENQASHWRQTVVSLLRQYSPDVGSRVTQKYLSTDDLAISDLNEIKTGKNLTAVTDRIAGEIAKGNPPSEILSLFLELHRLNPQLSYRILDGLLGYFETNPVLAKFENELMPLGIYYLDDHVPVAIKHRFLRFTVRFAQNQLLLGENRGLFAESYALLQISLPKLKELIPTLFDQALGLSLTMEAKISQANRERDEAYKRIAESKDKLQQTILEADAAENKSFEDILWLSASQFALKKKKFQTAADCVLKFQFRIKESVSIRDYMLLNTILPEILKDKDFESAEYVLRHINEPQSRGSGFLKIASKYKDVGNNSLAFERLEEALKLLRKIDPSADVIRIGLSSVPIAMKIEKLKAFETASSVIAIVNNLPTPNVDDTIGSPGRIKYNDTVLIPIAYNLVNAFQILADSDVGFAASTATEIRSKSWKLAVDVVVETKKPYPLPEETTPRRIR